MSDKAKKPVPQPSRTGPWRRLRTVWTGVAATAIALGVMFTASASVPAAHPSGGNDGELPIRLYGLLQSVTVGETDTAPEGITLGQIVAVLDRAEKQAQEQGPSFSPAIAQAAAELGMLYTTYQMQQLSLGENNEGLRVEDAPVARGSQDDAEAPSAGSDTGDRSAQDDAEQDDKAKQDRDAKQDDAKQDDKADQDGGAERDESIEPRKVPERFQPEEDGPPAVEVSNQQASVIDSHDDDPQAGYITYDEVVIAAVRLANMLDPSVPNALVEVDGVDEQGQRFSLRENLLDVVTMFGDTTTEYANGRIPTDVLCPLEFAPGHMLRCDAAERFTALSALFEQEFGYPIPITDSYRSYEAQVTLAGIKPHLAAIPGTSNHGWGLAVDLGNPIAGGNSPEYVWLRVHGPDYGWDNPSWAQLDGSKPEPWHFEFFAAGSIPNRAIDPSDVGTWTPADADSPRYKPTLDPKPSDGTSAGEVRKPVTKPADSPPSQKPTKPADKPKPPKDEGGKPGDSTPKPKPTPTKPGPSPSPSDPEGPDPSPSPSEPEPEPSPSEPESPEPSPSPSEPEPDPSPSPDPTEPTCPDENEDEGKTAKTAKTDGQADGASASALSSEDDEAEPDQCPDEDAEDENKSSGGGEGGSAKSSSLSGTKPEELGVLGDSTED